MIKSENGEVRISGTKYHILADVVMIINAIYDEMGAAALLLALENSVIKELDKSELSENRS